MESEVWMVRFGIRIIEMEADVRWMVETAKQKNCLWRD